MTRGALVAFPDASDGGPRCHEGRRADSESTGVSPFAFAQLSLMLPSR